MHQTRNSILISRIIRVISAAGIFLTKQLAVATSALKGCTRIVNKLLEEGACVTVYDPFSMKNAKEIFGDKVTYASTATECFTDADGCILVTEWDEFKTVKPEDFIEKMKEPAVVDVRGIRDPKEFWSKG